MSLGGIKQIRARQSGDKSAAARRRVRNILLATTILGISYALERVFSLHSAVHGLLEWGESFGADTLLLTALLTLLGLIGVQILDMRSEMNRRRLAEAQAVALAYHDTLTGLPNRRKFEEHLNRLEAGRVHAVLMIDLDDFKPVNDLFGHAAGDEVLIQSAHRIAAVCGRGSLVARFGGDEFAAVTGPLNNEDDAQSIGAAIAIAFETPFKVGRSETRVGVSVGVSLLKAGERPPMEAVREADLALYRVKADTSITHQIYEKGIEDELRRRKTVEDYLRKAIASGTLEPHYQPLVDLRTNEVIGFEALARWTDPELGVINPVEFISVAERSGLIIELSDYLFRRACRDAVEWPDHLKLSFNLSPMQLRDKLAGLRILNVLGDTGLSPHRLEIEVTESCLTEDKKQAHRILGALHNAGIRIAIDDFGTGYSSLYHLREFQFDNLKIDRSFISALGKSLDDAVIINTILSLSHGLGLRTTAEGIESEDQLNSLIMSGCDQGQGYLFGKAMPQSDVLKLIDEFSVEAQRA
jgi:diguanylate cyclase (GGDEF)-like protein